MKKMPEVTLKPFKCGKRPSQYSTTFCNLDKGHKGKCKDINGQEFNGREFE
jgi:hypothetical protein